MKKIFTQTLATAINGFLKLDPETNKRFEKLAGKVVTIELLPLHFLFQIIFSNRGIQIELGDHQESAARIKGTPLSMMAVMLDKKNRQAFFGDDLVIEGNAELAQAVIHLFDQLQIDWEEYLSLIIGDMAAVKTGKVINRVKSWLQTTEEKMTANVTEFVQEEAQWLPTREALQDFFHDIDAIRMDVDRLSAKIAALKNRNGAAT